MRYPSVPGAKERGGTSEEAGDAIAGRAGTLRAMAFSMFEKTADGLTADEVAIRLGESVLAIRPRISELYAMGKIKKTIERRRNASGMYACVWKVATPEQADQFDLELE